MPCALFPQLEPNSEWIAGIYRLTVLGCRAIMPRTCPRQLKRRVIESRAATSRFESQEDRIQGPRRKPAALVHFRAGQLLR